MAVQAQLYPENLGNLPMCGLQMQQDWAVINPVPVSSAAINADLRFSFQDTRHHHHFLFAHPDHSQQNPHQNLVFDSNSKASSSSSSTRAGNIFSSMAALPQSLHTQLELQRQELEFILHIQSERLRSALLEQRKQQLGAVLKSVESKAMNLMRQKEEDLIQATRRAMELEACLRKAEMESESWQRLARANEAMVMDLSNTLEQVKERIVLISNRAEDAESVCCDSCDDNNREQELKEERRKLACKRCNSRNSCVLLLPCRHLCSCKQCEAFLVSCPVCNSAKVASMEVFRF
ncbi:hypothetical protein CUMW_070290 [Citrus unshiu]|nr:hypothetical protein CUMW_070290 [Citrus unshiu]